MVFTYHPKPVTTISSSELADHVKDIASFEDRWVSGFDVSSSGLDIFVTTGEAYIAGYKVGNSGDGDESITLADNDDNHVYLKSDGSITSNTTGSDPADSIKIYVITTASGVVTVTSDIRDDTVEFLAPLVADEITSQGNVNGSNLALSATQPYVEMIDGAGGGDSFRIWNRNGNLEVTDPSGAIVYTENLADITTSLRKNVKDRLSTPPGSPATSDRYIVVATGTGAWAGQDDDIAEWNGSSWDFFTPEKGWFTFVEDENRLYQFDTAWRNVALLDTAVGPTANTIALRNGTGQLRAAAGTTADGVIVKSQLDAVEAASIESGDAAGGDLTGTYPNPTLGATVVDTAELVDNAVTNTKLADMSGSRVKGQIVGGSGDPVDMTVAQLVTLLNTGTLLDADTLDGLHADEIGVSFEFETGTSATMVSGKAYVADNAALVTFTLPSNPGVGKIVEVGSENTGGWKIALNAGDQIIFSELGVGIGRTTVGVGGSIESTDVNDWIQLVCVDSAGGGSQWRVRSQRGNILVT